MKEEEGTQGRASWWKGRQEGKKYGEWCVNGNQNWEGKNEDGKDEADRRKVLGKEGNVKWRR